jgi:uncharacterized protein YggT (Ycf19 family)
VEHREPDAERDPAPPGQVHEQRRVVSGDPAAVPPMESAEVIQDNPGWRAVQLVYLIFGVIDGLLLIRLVLKLLGANPNAGFSSWVYGFTDIFMAPFRSLLPNVVSGQSIFEMSAVVAILVYALVGWVIARLIAILFYRNVTIERRSGRYRPGGY